MKATPTPVSHFFVGLDLGQSADYSAITVLERTVVVKEGMKPVTKFACRHLQRWQLGTPYTTIADDVLEMITREPGFLRGCKLVVDRTGVGAAVVEMIHAKRLPCSIVPVLITGGHTVSCERGVWHVPKKELASVLQVLMQQRRLQIAKDLPEAATLVKELKAFKVKITTAGNEQFSAWRESDHDDLVLAVALSAWFGERDRATSRPMVLSRGPSVSDPARGLSGGPNFGSGFN